MQLVLQGLALRLSLGDLRGQLAPLALAGQYRTFLAGGRAAATADAAARAHQVTVQADQGRLWLPGQGLPQPARRRQVGRHHHPVEQVLHKGLQSGFSAHQGSRNPNHPRQGRNA